MFNIVQYQAEINDLKENGSNGEEIPVNKHTIVDFQDNVEILIAKRRIITT
jgi:hypothetical protein